MDRIQLPDNSIELLYREMYFPLLHYAEAVLDEPALAEEAVQETFVIACVKRDALAVSPNPRGWIVNTLRNVLRNTQRRRSQLNRLFVDSLKYSEDRLVAKTEDGYLDAEYADLLSPDDYRLLKRIALERYTMKDAAEELGITVEACKKRVQRAKERLRTILQNIEASEKRAEMAENGEANEH